MGKEKSSAALITIGDEILLGHTLDTNSNYIASRLSETGIEVISIRVVSDNRDDIVNSLTEAFRKTDVIIITGGLGPTVDDITRPVLAEFFNSKLVYREDLMKKIADFYADRDFPMFEQVRLQAYFPENAEPIDNQFGTAPGMLFRKDRCMCFSVPGVPREMKGMMDNYIIPLLIAENRGRALRYRIIRLTGLGESAVAEKIGNWKFPDVHLAFLPNYGRVDLRISTENNDDEECEKILELAFNYIQDKIGDHIYGEGDQELVRTIGELLLSKGWKLAVAESCTGGMLGSMITDISGSSEYFVGGFVTYANETKIEQLGVPADLIENYGAVSEQVACKMAEGAALKTGAEVGIGITGIAGPTGGTNEKPVGTTYIGLTTPAGTEVTKFEFKDDRKMNRYRAAFSALNLLFRKLRST